MMELAAGPPTRWIITLADGGEAHVWADGVTGLSDKTLQDEEFVFSVLMDIDVDRQSEFEVTARGVKPGRRVDVAVARFPRRSVREVRSVH
jgi:hypothetical protein